MIDHILANKINKMARKDQSMRKRARKTGIWNTSVDHANTNALIDLIDHYGWPTISLVGKKSSTNAWLLAQHADHDIGFQKRSLTMLKREYVKNPKNINPANIAFLTDRILVAQKKKQIFGTQFHVNKRGMFVLRPIKDKINIDKRRKEFNLPPLQTYLESARGYAKKIPNNKS